MFESLRPTGFRRIAAEALAVRGEARREWRSGQNLSALQAETNFGHRKSASKGKAFARIGSSPTPATTKSRTPFGVLSFCINVFEKTHYITAN
ncbi:MAG: hypothetical protein IJ872_01115, partial [Eubacterium sp.]|nr:hypothetical protein [Eubacterium sp.]